MEKITEEERLNLVWNFNFEFNGQNHSKTGYIIYKIENTISEIVYIGQTRRPLKRRWNDYQNNLLKPVVASNKRKGANLHLKHSFQKHFVKEKNVDFLKFSIVEILDVAGLQTEEERQNYLNEKEELHIKEYKELYGKDKICNILDGGRQHVWSEEEKKINTENQKKFWNSSEGKELREKTTQKQKASLQKFLQTEEGKNQGKNHSQKLLEFYKTEEGVVLKKKLSEANKRTFEEKFGKEKAEEKKKQLSSAFSGEKNPFYGKTHSEEALEKMGAARRGKKQSEEWKQKISLSLLGKSAKLIDLIENPLISPTGEIYKEIFNLLQFCKKNNLNYGNMQTVIKGTRKQTKGWHLQFEKPILPPNPERTDYGSTELPGQEFRKNPEFDCLNSP